jgi:hypothetical protein
MKTCFFLVLLLCPAGRATGLEDVSLVEPSNALCSQAGPGKDGSCSASMLQMKQLKEKAEVTFNEQGGADQHHDPLDDDQHIDPLNQAEDPLDDDQHIDPLDQAEDFEDPNGVENAELLAKEVAKTGESGEIATQSDTQVAPLLAGVFIRGALKVGMIGLRAGAKAWFKKVNKASMEKKALDVASGISPESVVQYIETAHDAYQLVPHKRLAGCVTSLKYSTDKLVGKWKYEWVQWCAPVQSESSCESYAGCKWADLLADAPEAKDIAEQTVMCAANRRSHGKCGR